MHSDLLFHLGATVFLIYLWAIRPTLTPIQTCSQDFLSVLCVNSRDQKRQSTTQISCVACKLARDGSAPLFGGFNSPIIMVFTPSSSCHTHQLHLCGCKKCQQQLWDLPFWREQHISDLEDFFSLLSSKTNILLNKPYLGWQSKASFGLLDTHITKKPKPIILQLLY